MTVATTTRTKTAARKQVATPGAATKTGRAPTTLTLSSKNYSSWSLRGWLMARFVGLEFTEVMVSPDDADARKELLLLAPSIRVPCLTHEGARVWNTLAIAQYLNEIKPEAGLMPAERIARAHCRSVSGEMNSGFANLRASLPMNLKGTFPGHKVWAGAQPDIDRISEIWSECLATYGGPFLFGKQRTMADAMFAPVVTRFLTYDVKLNKACILYCQTIMAMPEMKEWIAAAKLEPDDIEELDTTDLAAATPIEALSSIQKFALFMRMLAPPAASSDTPGGSASVAAGKSLFGSVGCALCHTLTLHTGNAAIAALRKQRVDLYSDLLLHDMGHGLADGITQGQAGPREFRTAPLWGLGQRLFFLHDGRTPDLREALLAHQSERSEANGVISRFTRLADHEQQDVLNFLRSL